jgi:xanthine dehydrogenase accessory factor
VLLVLSATPVASHLLGWAGQLGFEPILVESRSERLEDFPAPERLVTSLTGLADLGGREICAVATDHDTPEMVPLLEEIARLKPAFVGVMGSRRHTGHHLEALLAHGLDPGVVAAIQTPVGIDIGARTPAEIALSILAGVVAMRNGGSVRWLDLKSRQG